MFRFIIGYTLIFTAFTTIATSPAVGAPQCQTDTQCEAQEAKEQQQLKQCLISAGFWQARARKLGLTAKQVKAIAAAQTKQCLKGGTK